MSDAPKRDKFAAMAAHQQPQATAPKSAAKRDKFSAISSPRGNKFAAMATQQASSKSAQEEQKKKDDLERIKQRSQQRDKVWKDLQDAEAATMKLLSIAEETAKRLSARQVDNETAELSQQYSDVLAKIHAHLAPHASLVQAYTAPARTHRMYLARVEQRIAGEKRNLLKEYLRMEEEQTVGTKEEMSGIATGGKRKREG